MRLAGLYEKELGGASRITLPSMCSPLVEARKVNERQTLQFCGAEELDLYRYAVPATPSAT